MGKIVLEEKVKFSQQSYLSDTLFKSNNLLLELLCMEEGQAVLSKIRNSQIILLVVSGNGSLTQGSDTCSLKADSLLIFEGVEQFEIKASKQMTILQYVIPPP